MKISLILTVVLFLAFTGVAYAQEQQPANAQDLIDGVTALIAAFAGLLGSIVVNLIKQIPGLSEGDRSRLNGAAAEVIAVVVGIVTGAAVGLVAQSLDLIGDSSLRLLVISLAAPIVSELRYRLVKLTAPKPVPFDRTFRQAQDAAQDRLSPVEGPPVIVESATV